MAVTGVPKSTYCWMQGHPEAEPGSDSIEQDVVAASESVRREYSAPRIKRALAKRGVVATRRRITRIMKAKGLVNSYSKAKFKPSGSKASETDPLNVLNGDLVVTDIPAK